jgi:translation initiation factor 1A|tara:strand:- start:269 stop:772 length:504 start_codon:yes stop_codon:yes gene_type:complete
MTGKGKGGKKHRRGKNISSDNNAVIPDEHQYFAYVTKILGSGRVSLDYYIPKFNDKTNEIIDWIVQTKIGVIRGKMMRRVYVNLNDIVLVSEREFEDSKVDIIEKYQMTQIPYLKKYANFPPMNEISNNDVEFDFEGELVLEDSKSKVIKSEDYMCDIPTFAEIEDD